MVILLTVTHESGEQAEQGSLSKESRNQNSVLLTRLELMEHKRKSSSEGRTVHMQGEFS